MGSSCLLLSGAGVLRVAQGVPQAWLGVTWGDAHRLRPTPPTVAMTPRALQVKVKRHVQLILERLLHTVNRRVIVLERDNSLRVSYHRLRRARDRSASPGDEEVREGLHDVGMGSRWQTFLGGAVASDSSCWGWVCGYLTQQDARGSPKKEGGNAAEAGRGVGGVLGGARRVFVMQEARLEADAGVWAVFSGKRCLDPTNFPHFTHGRSVLGCSPRAELLAGCSTAEALRRAAAPGAMVPSCRRGKRALCKCGQPGCVEQARHVALGCVGQGDGSGGIWGAVPWGTAMLCHTMLSNSVPRCAVPCCAMHCARGGFLGQTGSSAIPRLALIHKYVAKPRCYGQDGTFLLTGRAAAPWQRGWPASRAIPDSTSVLLEWPHC